MSSPTTSPHLLPCHGLNAHACKVAHGDSEVMLDSLLDCRVKDLRVEVYFYRSLVPSRQIPSTNPGYRNMRMLSLLLGITTYLDKKTERGRGVVYFSSLRVSYSL